MEGENGFRLVPLTSRRPSLYLSLFLSHCMCVCASYCVRVAPVYFSLFIFLCNFLSLYNSLCVCTIFRVNLCLWVPFSECVCVCVPFSPCIFSFSTICACFSLCIFLSFPRVCIFLSLFISLSHTNRPYTYVHTLSIYLPHRGFLCPTLTQALSPSFLTLLTLLEESWVKVKTFFLDKGGDFSKNR